MVKEKQKHPNIDLLINIDKQKETLLQNTTQFARGFSANNALLWGARGMGKSSLIKAVHNKLSQTHNCLKLLEIYRHDISSLNVIIRIISKFKYRFIIDPIHNKLI